MQGERFVAVGTRVQGGEASALLGLAARHGVDVRAAALRPPATPTGGLEWHVLTVPATTESLLGGLVQHLTRRVLRGEAAELADALAADRWLERQLADPATGTTVIALDDVAAQALARWSREHQRSTPAILTWDKGADRLAELLAGAPAADVAPQTTTGARNPGAMHRIAVAVAQGRQPRRELVALGPSLRAKIAVVEGAEPVPADLDVLVLDGFGPAVARLRELPTGVRVVHLPREEDRSSFWRHLLSAPATGRAGLVTGRTDRPSLSEEELGDLVLGPTAARLARLGRARDDDAALALITEQLDGGPLTDPILLREMTYQTRVTGSLSLERRVLQSMAALPGAGAAVDEALARVGDRLRETDTDWSPTLPTTPVDPVPGRVLHLLKTTMPQRQAGYSVRGHHTLRALADTGADVIGVALPERVETPGEEAAAQPGRRADEVVLDGVRYVLTAPVEAASGTAYLEAAARTLLDVVVAERPEVLHVHSGHRGYDLGVVGAAVAAATGLPWVYELRGLFESTWSQDPVRSERGELFERRMGREADLARRADVAVTLAETMRQDLVDRGVPADHVHVVPNAVDPERLRPAVRDEELARRFGADGRFTFGYVSNLDHERERVEDLVRAALVLRSRGLPVRALVVGSGTREQELTRMATTLGADDVVTFTGRVPHDEVAAAYGLLDVLVVPRSDERAARLVTPLKPFEAMAMGLPVVVSAQPALLEVIGDGERGWSYPAGDPEALADVLEGLAHDPEGRARTAARARQWVTRHRTWAHNATAYSDIYRSLARGSG